MKLTLFDKLKLYKISQDKNMISKLKSRKLWASVIGAALATLGSQLGLDPALVDKLINIVMLYVVAQAGVDVAVAATAKK